MPRFFFNLVSDEDVSDTEGAVLPGLEEVKEAALAEARQIIAARIIAGKPIFLSSYISVDDEQGIEVHLVQFRDAMILVDWQGDQLCAVKL